MVFEPGEAMALRRERMGREAPGQDSESKGDTASLPVLFYAHGKGGSAWDSAILETGYAPAGWRRRKGGVWVVGWKGRDTGT